MPKTSAADTNARLALNTPATLKEDPKKQEAKEAKDQKYTADESEKTPAQPESEKNSSANNTTTTPNSAIKSNKEEPKAPASGDESLFRAAMQYQQQGDMNEAINQFKKLSGNERYSERAKYQLAMIYKNKGQNGKARRLFKEIIKMEGNMKSLAQAQLNNMN
jgi:TolA-binding protein